MPMVKQFGIDPIHFGVIMVFNLMIGLVTPPVGTVLYTLMRVTGLSLERLSVAMIPWYVPLADHAWRSSSSSPTFPSGSPAPSWVGRPGCRPTRPRTPARR